MTPTEYVAHTPTNEQALLHSLMGRFFIVETRSLGSEATACAKYVVHNLWDPVAP
ncbi:hypothetical protein LINGRAHAP2_LOCUS8274 [Linum grandiflorum]